MASTYLIKPGEHTWGISSLPDNVNWTNSAFEKAKSGEDLGAVGLLSNSSPFGHISAKSE